jgi:hypothetical protein
MRKTLGSRFHKNDNDALEETGGARLRSEHVAIFRLSLTQLGLRQFLDELHQP